MTTTDELPATQQVSPDEIPFIDIVRDIVARIEYRPDYRFEVEIDKKDPQGRVYIQLWHTRPDAVTGATGEGRGGKRYLSPHMTDSEIVRACLGACLAYEEHEVREFFRYRPDGEAEARPIFGPHGDVNMLWRVADILDIRQ
jgi:hypothetical protein